MKYKTLHKLTKYSYNCKGKIENIKQEDIFPYINTKLFIPKELSPDNKKYVLLILGNKYITTDISNNVHLSYGYILQSGNTKTTHTQDNVAISIQSSTYLVNNRTLLLYIKDTMQEIGNNTSKDIEILINDIYLFVGTGTADLTITNSKEAFLNNGNLGVRHYLLLDTAIKQHASLETIVLGSVQGSIDDLINMETGRLLRKSKLNTKVLANSDITSGGVDLFASGVERIYTQGAKIGVHSWCCNSEGQEAAKLPKHDKAHFGQLSYFTQMLPKTGQEFYFYTLQAAPFNSIHWMSLSEIQKYTLITK